ncbi:ABC transporter permease [Nocardioides lijunqiniae]|uniref:ABC transporter permease n=1 Tax=Nocardioides lijunqiniae TaxID=2760832 RepID=UPI0030B84E7C
MTALVDALMLGWQGVGDRRARAAMSALGIALGMATLVLVTGIPASGQADLDRQLDAMGTTMLVAQPSAAIDTTSALPLEAAAMVRRIAPVESASAIANLNVPVVRDRYADPNRTAGVTAMAATPDLLAPIGGSLDSGVFLTDTTSDLPTVVLGHQAAAWLGVTTVDFSRPRQILVGGAPLTVIGILAPMPLARELEQSVFVGQGTAGAGFGFTGHPTVVYLRAAESQVEAVRDVLPATLDPEVPGLISVSRPSDALAAQRAAQGTFSGLFLGLAGVALLIGGVGVANTMIVSVLERRREIGLRRALGATRRDIRRQFLIEAVLLSLLGGAAGLLLGAIGCVGYAAVRGWPVVVPLPAVAGAVLGVIVVGALAGLYPAVKASRLSPTVALGST